MFRYTLLVWVLLALILHTALGNAAPFNLITSDGNLRSTLQIEKYFEGAYRENEDLKSVVGLLDCSSVDNDCKLVNDLLGAHFTSTSNGKILVHILVMFWVFTM